MMKLEKLLEYLKPRSVTGSLDRFIRDLQYDSRKVEAEHAFIALRGFKTDGHQYVQEAYNRGARVFFLEEEQAVNDATVVCMADTREGMAKIARVFYNFPDHKLKIIGITGTNGKTTTAYLLHSILKFAHWQPGLISTIEYVIRGKRFAAERTTPESLDLMRLFYQMVQKGLKSVVMEVSSHALALKRVEGVPFLAGVFTNLGRDHLDFHGNLENYFLAKRKLFENFNEYQKVILNEDDPRSEDIQQVTKGEIFTYSMKNPRATVCYLSHEVLPGGMHLNLSTPLGNLKLTSTLIGMYNIYNIMAAVTTSIALGFDEKFILQGIRDLERIPGRCEYYPTPVRISIYVDYAHTPEGLQQILKAVWDTKPSRIIVVFGAGGDRDRGKRPQMGRAAEDFADLIFLTNDNPRSEEPEAIIAEIMAGIENTDKVVAIPDRREAILQALRQARTGDAVVIAGKGHEKFQEFKGVKYPFDDRAVIREFFEEKGWEFSSR
ncbi:MAG: UDP-N-acetylmuramoyl-L-alanyl-D-glutamate--2,6-diaminopimelate ligase [Calditrichia bacterium]